ncbi:MAG: TMEM165/GDT1 family protein [Candidatus Lokiarchaeota archaeon]|nr:TMEM165/GDT1 family protein [Candidatus Lokiarchaeota archaeon]
MSYFNFQIFLISFGIIFLAELGDKTQLMVITLAAKEKSSFKIGLATSIGISLVVIIGIIIGFFLNLFIPNFWIKLAGIIIFLIFGIYTLIMVKKNDENLDEKQENDELISKKSRFNISNTFLFALSSIFIMEFGDKTQLMTISLTANYSLPIEVGLGAILALSSLCFLGAYLGELISKKVKKRWIDIAGGTLFIIVGIIMVFEMIFTL